MWFWIHVWGLLLLVWRISLGSFVRHICSQWKLSFCLVNKMNVFISSSYLKDSFAGYKILAWQLFYFWAFWIYHTIWLFCLLFLVNYWLIPVDSWGWGSGVRSYCAMITDFLLRVMTKFRKYTVVMLIQYCNIINATELHMGRSSSESRL